MKEKKEFYKNWWFIALVAIVYTIIVAYISYYTTINVIQRKVVETFSNSLGTITEDNNDIKDKEDIKTIREKEIKDVNLDEKIEEKDWEITIKETGFKQDIIPSNPDSYYRHYQVKDTDNTYFYLAIEAKNISSLGLRADSVAKVKMKYDNNYEYITSSAIEESGGGDFTYTNITTIAPLTNGKIYYMVEIPKAIAEEESKAVEAQITINNNTYRLKIR